jgi:hypothetical protein
MNNVGIWIDHGKAVIVSASADRVTVNTLESNVGPHSRYSARAGATMSEGGPQDEGGEKRYEESAVQVHRWNRDHGQVDRSADRREGEGALRDRSLRTIDESRCAGAPPVPTTNRWSSR